MTKIILLQLSIFIIVQCQYDNFKYSKLERKKYERRKYFNTLTNWEKEVIINHFTKKYIPKYILNLVLKYSDIKLILSYEKFIKIKSSPKFEYILIFKPSKTIIKNIYNLNEICLEQYQKVEFFEDNSKFILFNIKTDITLFHDFKIKKIKLNNINTIINLYVYSNNEFIINSKGRVTFWKYDELTKNINEFIERVELKEYRDHKHFIYDYKTKLFFGYTDTFLRIWDKNGELIKKYYIGCPTIYNFKNLLEQTERQARKFALARAKERLERRRTVGWMVGENIINTRNKIIFSWSSYLCSVENDNLKIIYSLNCEFIKNIYLSPNKNFLVIIYRKYGQYFYIIYNYHKKNIKTQCMYCLDHKLSENDSFTFSKNSIIIIHQDLHNNISFEFIKTRHNFLNEFSS